MGAHQRGGTGFVLRATLGRPIHLAPGGALPIDQLLPAKRLRPMRQLLRGNTLFFEIMKSMALPTLVEPGTGFFDRVAIGNAVDGDHAADCARKKRAGMMPAQERLQREGCRLFYSNEIRVALTVLMPVVEATPVEATPLTSTLTPLNRLSAAVPLRNTALL